MYNKNGLWVGRGGGLVCVWGGAICFLQTIDDVVHIECCHMPNPGFPLKVLRYIITNGITVECLDL